MSASPTAPAGDRPTAAVTAFLDTLWAQWPVTATYAGISDHDAELPDWSPHALEAAAVAWRAHADALRAARGADTPPIGTLPLPTSREEADLLAAEASALLLAEECSSRHGPGRNPVFATGECAFALLSLFERAVGAERDVIDDAAANATTRLLGVPELLDGVQRSIDTRSVPAEWRDRAIAECGATIRILSDGLPLWLRTTHPAAPWSDRLRAAAVPARGALAAFARWLEDDVPVAHSRAVAVGADAFERRIRLAHWEPTHPEALLPEATAALDEAVEAWRAASAAHAGDWSGVLARLGREHPTRETYLARVQDAWHRHVAFVRDHDLVTWPDDRPVRFIETREWARPGSAALYYLNYRCPPPHAPPAPLDHQLPFLATDDSAVATLAAMHQATISLNHVIHHAGLGHHAQNAWAARAASPVGRVAAVDGASRLALPVGGTMAEGWACYAVDAVEEVGGLDPLEQAVQAHTRVRLLCRAVVDLALHCGEWTRADAERCFVARAAMSAAAAAAEVTRATVHPGTAVMYWLGTRTMHAMRRELAPQFPSRRAFHDAVLAHGALPLPMIAHLLRVRAR